MFEIWDDKAFFGAIRHWFTIDEYDFTIDKNIIGFDDRYLFIKVNNPNFDDYYYFIYDKKNKEMIWDYRLTTKFKAESNESHLERLKNEIQIPFAFIGMGTDSEGYDRGLIRFKEGTLARNPVYGEDYDEDLEGYDNTVIREKISDIFMDNLDEMIESLEIIKAEYLLD